MSNPAPTPEAMQSRLRLRLCIYDSGIIAALCIIFGLLGDALGFLNMAVRGYCCALVFLTVHESQELSWGHPLWKGIKPQLALFTSVVAVFFLIPSALHSSALMLPVILYFLFALYAVYKNLSGTTYFTLYPILAAHKSSK